MADAVHDAKRLAELQALPLERKILITQTRIIEWYTHFNGKVCVSFSGGKDSTVLLHITRQLYPDIRAMFVNTGLEYPEIVRFAHQSGVDAVRPKMRFDEVISTYGYPLIGKEAAQNIWEARQPNYKRSKSKFDDNSEYCRRYGEAYSHSKWLPLLQLPIGISHLCCKKTKKNPAEAYQKKNDIAPIIATLAEESRLRKNAWIKHGCNAFDGKVPKSQPLSFWTEQDILRYIVKYGVEIASVYGDIVAYDDEGNEYDPCMMAESLSLKCTGCDRTGCIFCAFGFHTEKKGKTRFQRLAITHPKQYEYALGGGQWVDNPKYDPVLPEYDRKSKNWNPKKIWVPSKRGLGMRKVFDMVNEVYGKDFYRYE